MKLKIFLLDGERYIAPSEADAIEDFVRLNDQYPVIVERVY